MKVPKIEWETKFLLYSSELYCTVANTIFQARTDPRQILDTVCGDLDDWSPSTDSSPRAFSYEEECQNMAWIANFNWLLISCT